MSVPPLDPNVITTAVDATAQYVHYATTFLAARQDYAPDAAERSVRQLDSVVQTLSDDVYQVNYYISDSLNDRIPNPSNVFRRHGFRLDGSNWVFPKKGLEHDDVKAVFAFWDAFNAAQPVPEGQAGLLTFRPAPKVRFWVIPYTKGQLAAMREGAREQLAEAVREVHRSLITRIDHAAEGLALAQKQLDAQGSLGPLGVPVPPEEAQEDPELAAARAKARARIDNNYNGAVRDSLRDAIERFESCLKGAELFDDTGSLDSLFSALRDVVKAQAGAANAMLAAKGRKLVDVPASISGEGP